MPYCRRCDRDFRSWPSYEQHIRDSSFHWVCDECDQDFETWDGLEQHFIQSPAHHYCRQCGEHFHSDYDLRKHCIEDHYYCDICNRFFQSAIGLREHNRQRHSDIYCPECDRVFRSENNLREHLNSSVHRPRNIPCAFQHRGCTKFFVSKSAMISHLENGACPSGADRRMINRWVQLNDRQNVVTVPRRLLTEGGEDTRYYATERAWNGSAYECVLCHNTFGTLDVLNRHLASPRHQERTYRCPHESCLKRFTTLSGLCRHVESEACGVLRFRAVRDGMDHLLRNMGRLRIQGENALGSRPTLF